MSAFDNTKDTAAAKAEETKGFGQQKAGEAQGAAQVCISEIIHPNSISMVVWNSWKFRS